MAACVASVGHELPKINATDTRVWNAFDRQQSIGTCSTNTSKCESIQCINGCRARSFRVHADKPNSPRVACNQTATSIETQPMALTTPARTFRIFQHPRRYNGSILCHQGNQLIFSHRRRQAREVNVGQILARRLERDAQAAASQTHHPHRITTLD